MPLGSAGCACDIVCRYWKQSPCPNHSRRNLFQAFVPDSSQSASLLAASHHEDFQQMRAGLATDVRGDAATAPAELASYCPDRLSACSPGLPISCPGAGYTPKMVQGGLRVYVRLRAREQRSEASALQAIMLSQFAFWFRAVYFRVGSSLLHRLL